MSRLSRDSNMELLRMLSMLIIVIHHSVIHGVQGQDCLNGDLFWFAGGVGVNCFVLISGYYMIGSRVTLNKMIRLWLTVLTYSLSLYVLIDLCLMGHDVNPKNVIRACLPICTQVYWFITAYVLLLLVSPFLNHFLCSLTKENMARFFIVAALLLFLAPGVRTHFTWFIFLYAIAAYIRMYGERLVRYSPMLWMAAAATCALLIVVAAVVNWEVINFPVHGRLFTSKNSICSLLCSLSLFIGFAGMKVGCIRWVNIAASCTLGVYLLHDNAYVRKLLWNGIFDVKPLTDSLSLIPYCLCASVLVFACCTMIEYLRNAVLGRMYDWLISRWILPCAYSVWRNLRAPVEKLIKYL